MSLVSGVITAAQLEREFAGVRCELVDGEVIELAPGNPMHGEANGFITAALVNFNNKHRLGRVVSHDTGFVISRDPDTVLAPDVAFIRASRVPDGLPRRGYFEGAPDLAVEVMSPNDSLVEVEAKVDRYLNAGTEQVWVVNPNRRTVSVHSKSRMIEVYRAEDVLGGGGVLPGFELKVGEIFG